MICLSRPKINARSRSRSSFAGALFDRACEAEVRSGICVWQRVALELLPNVWGIVGLWMRVPHRDHRRCEYHRTQKSGCNPSRVAIQSRNCLQCAG